jgi:hypothetical protein
MRKSVVIAILVLIPVGLAHAQIPSAERNALIALYNSTDGDNWTNKHGWLVDSNECDWHGVFCTLPPEHVRILGLRLNGLVGSIPEALKDLDYLENLQLDENQLSGPIPKELGYLSNLTYMDLSENQLSGPIPEDFRHLTNLTWLDLSHNELTNVIPAEMEHLSSLTHLILTDNQLSGKLPPELWNLPSLVYFHAPFNQLSGKIPSPDPGDLPAIENIRLSHNRFHGEIPSEFEYLTTLEYLLLLSNRLSGPVPIELMDLDSTLRVNGGLDLRWNALYSNNASLDTFLAAKHSSPYGGWDGYQTIAPENLGVPSNLPPPIPDLPVGGHTVWLSWDAVSYTVDPGGYEVFSSPAGTGKWRSRGWTESKTTTLFPVTGLDPDTTYDFAVKTYTDPHVNDPENPGYSDNFNRVKSDLSTDNVQESTTSSSCGRPVIQVSGWGPFTLSLTETYDAYLWSTGVTDPSIDVTISDDQWFWVTVISGACIETAAIDPFPIFHDEFETGGTGEWSQVAP